MKLIFVIRGLHDIGGIERVTSIIANALVVKDYQISIVCLQKGKPYFELNHQINLHYLSSKFFKKNQLREIYKKEQPDIVIFLGSHRSMMNIPASQGIPSITWEHFNAKVNWHPLHKYSRKLAVNSCAKIVTLTQDDVTNYQELFDAKNVVCIPNPLTVNNIEKSSLNSKILLAVGRLASQKGFDLLIDAWSKTKAKDSGWNLRIVGDGRHQKRLEDQIGRLHLNNSITLTPSTKDIVREYKKANAFVMSSRFEGFGLVLVEAMAAGLPIVSFDCEVGPREIIKNNHTGLLVPPNNFEELAKSIDELVLNEHKIKEFSKNSLLEVERFSISSIVEKWEQLFNEILAKHRNNK